jgi:hypothetical protein
VHCFDTAGLVQRLDAPLRKRSSIERDFKKRPESKTHLLTEVRSTSSFSPQTIRMTEERLVGKRYAARPTPKGYETPEQCRARLDAEQAREQAKWNNLMGVRFGGDPEGC